MSLTLSVCSAGTATLRLSSGYVYTGLNVINNSKNKVSYVHPTIFNVIHSLHLKFFCK